jgi:hypothetical protein
LDGPAQHAAGFVDLLDGEVENVRHRAAVNFERAGRFD